MFTSKSGTKCLVSLSIVAGLISVIAGAAQADWPEHGQLTATTADPAGDQLGHSVSISGFYALAGAAQDATHGANSGAAYVFKRDGALWTQQANLTGGAGTAGDEFGHAVAISRDDALVGAWQDGDGAAYVFKRVGDIWTEQDKFSAGDPASEFGRAVAISGEYAVVGAIQAAYVFKRAR